MRNVQIGVRALATAAAMGGACAAAGQQEGDRPPVHERAGDAHAPPTDPPVLTPPGDSGIAEFKSIQVNVRSGQNIRNDAANEPSIAVDPTAPNRMVIGWRQFDNIASNFRQAGYAWTDDGGRTWNFPGVIEPGIFRSDPVLLADRTGRFYYSSLANDFSTQLFVSTDSGRTWPTKFQVPGGDKQWLALDQSRGIGDGNIYQEWSIAAGCCGDRTFTRSINGGSTWMNPQQLPQTPFWGTLGVDQRSGTLYVVGFGWPGYRPVIVRSDNARDGSQTPTWPVVTNVNLGGEVNFGGSPNPGGLLGQIWVGVDESGGPNDGNVYMLGSLDPPGTDPHDILFIRSTDGGRTWSAPVKVNNDAAHSGAWQWFGSMSVAPNGRIDVVWNDTRESLNPRLNKLYYAWSDDAGRTWQGNIPVSEQFDSHVGWPNQNKLGDYYQIISDRVGAHVAYAATFNGEQDVYYLRINDYDCNGNGVGDKTDIDNGTARDCNRNGIPDSCDIASGTSKDENRDGVPDECAVCYADCDGNGVLDIRDFFCFQSRFASGNAYADCDGNSVFDIRDFFCYQGRFAEGCR